MAKKEQLSYSQILSGIKSKNFKPIYLFMGEEPYFIDRLTNEIINEALKEEERDFNQTIIYGADATARTVINAAKRYPMMAERQLVVVKEAQQGPDWGDLIYYAQKPSGSTVLVVNYKNGNLRNAKLIAEIEKVGIVFESAKLYDNNLPTFIATYLAEQEFVIEGKAIQMLTDSIGPDLSRLTTELDKLIVGTQNSVRITALQVEQNVGISKDFNNFELIDAISARNIFKINQIQQYFEKNPKANPFVLTLSQLFTFFSNLLLFHFSKDKSESGIMAELKIKKFATKRYFTAANVYNAYKCIDVIALLRKYDRQSKGGEGTLSMTDAERLKELLYKITH